MKAGHTCLPASAYRKRPGAFRRHPLRRSANDWCAASDALQSLTRYVGAADRPACESLRSTAPTLQDAAVRRVCDVGASPSGMASDGENFDTRATHVAKCRGHRTSDAHSQPDAFGRVRLVGILYLASSRMTLPADAAGMTMLERNGRATRGTGRCSDLEEASVYRGCGEQPAALAIQQG